ncbi:MAG TPA: hypothetical protein VJH55_02700 [Candidatus Paceibacterota bacterium]
MLNLLPEDKKVILKNDYLLRFSIVAVLLACLVIVIGIVLLLPSYLLLHATELALEDELRLKQNTESSKEYEKLRGLIKNANADLATLTPTEVTVRELIELVVNKKGPAISIAHITATRKTDRAVTMLVGGVAKTREDLVAFTRVLEADRAFEKVVLPVSNLAKSKDIVFTLSVYSK